MTFKAALFLILAWAFVLGLTFWSWWKLLKVDSSHEKLPPPGTSL